MQGTGAALEDERTLLLEAEALPEDEEDVLLEDEALPEDDETDGILLEDSRGTSLEDDGSSWAKELLLIGKLESLLMKTELLEY